MKILISVIGGLAMGLMFFILSRIIGDCIMFVAEGAKPITFNWFSWYIILGFLTVFSNVTTIEIREGVALRTFIINILAVLIVAIGTLAQSLPQSFSAQFPIF